MRLQPLAAAFVAAFGTSAVVAQTAAPAPTAEGSTASSSTSGASALPTIRVQGESDKDSFTTTDTSRGERRDVPQSVIVVNKALLQSQGGASLQDALRNVPGITLGGAEGGNIGNNINLNGFAARTDIYLDGFRDRGQYYRDTFALESVEALMGPSSMLFGRGSTGGVINQVTKKPSLERASEVTGSVTTNGMVRATVDHNRPLSDTIAVRISAMAQDGAPSTRDVMKNRDFGVAPSVKLGINTPTTITLSALIQHNRDMPDYGVSPLNGAPAKVDRNAFYGFTNDRLIQDIVSINGTIEHKLTPTALLRNRTGLNVVHTDAVETASNTIGTVTGAGFAALTPAATSALPLDQLWVRLQSHDRVIQDKSLSNQTEFNIKLASGGVKQDVLAGLELAHDTYRNQNYYRNGTCNGVAMNPVNGTSGYALCVPLLNPPYIESPATAPIAAGNLVTSKADTVGLYVNDTVSIGNFKLVGGLRHDRFEASLNNTITSATTPAHAEQTVHFTSVRLGGVWQPSPTQSYYTSYSTSFNPSLEALTNTTGTTAPLPPQENKSMEAGGKWDLLNGDLSLDAAAFRIRQTNARSQNPDGTYSPTGTVQVDGVRLGGSGRLARGWKVFAGYSFLDADIVNAIAVGTQGKVPANTPRHTGTVWSTYDIAPHWELGGGATAQSGRFLNNTNLVGVPKFVRWDATLAYRQPSYDVRLNVFNLTDKYFYDALIQSDGGRAVPATGRSAMLSVAYRF